MTVTAGAQVDAVVALHQGGDPTGRRAEGAGEGGRAAFGDRHRQAKLAADRGDLAADEAAADDQHAAWCLGQALAQPRGVVAGADGEDPVERGFFRIRPRPGPGAGGNQQAIEGHTPSVGEVDALAGQVQAGGGDAEQPLRVEVDELRQGGVLHRQPAGQDRLRRGGRS